MAPLKQKGDLAELMVAADRATKRYTAATVDWIAAYDATTNRCFYLPAAELGDGRVGVSLRCAPARSNQRLGVRWAEDYRDF